MAWNSYSSRSIAAPHVAGAWAILRHAIPHTTVDHIEGLFDINGPDITHNATARKLLDVTAALAGKDTIPPPDGVVCFPILSSNGNASIICL